MNFCITTPPASNIIVVICKLTHRRLDPTRIVFITGFETFTIQSREGAVFLIYETPLQRSPREGQTNLSHRSHPLRRGGALPYLYLGAFLVLAQKRGSRFRADQLKEAPLCDPENEIGSMIITSTINDRHYHCCGSCIVMHKHSS